MVQARQGLIKTEKDRYRFFVICIRTCFVLLYCIILYCIVLCGVVLYYIVLYCIAMYCIVLCCIVLCCIVLYSYALCLTYTVPSKKCNIVENSSFFLVYSSNSFSVFVFYQYFIIIPSFLLFLTSHLFLFSFFLSHLFNF